MKGAVVHVKILLVANFYSFYAILVKSVLTLVFVAG